MRKYPPLLAFSGLTGSIYVVTRYSKREGGQIVAHEKYDVTARFDELIAERQDFLAGSAEDADIGGHRTP